MGLFDKNEKKLRQELGKKNLSRCKDAVKELNELYDDMKLAYEEIDTVVAEFLKFTEEATGRLLPDDAQHLESFGNNFKKVDKCARDAVRDIRDLLRSQKKVLREIQREA